MSKARTIIAGYAPTDEHEHALAVVVAEAFWRRQRLYLLEAPFMSARMTDLSGSGADPDEALTRIFTDPTEISRARLMLRYVAAAELAKMQVPRQEGAPEGKHSTFVSNGTDASDEFFLSAMFSKMPTRTESTSSGDNGFVSLNKPARNAPPPKPRAA